MLVKQPLTIKERLHFFKEAFEWLPLTHISAFDHDTRKWSIKTTSFKERLDCFLSELETAIIGYVYAYKEGVK